MNCPYQIRPVGDFFYVVRPIANPLPGTPRYFTVAGPFPDRAGAERAALRRWQGTGRQAA